MSLATPSVRTGAYGGGPPGDAEGWLERAGWVAAAGEIAGNAWSEVGNTAIDIQLTVLSRDGAS